MGLYDDLTWNTLNDAEKKLALCVCDGKSCDFGNGKMFDAARPESWKGQPKIRGPVIAALATGKIKNEAEQEIPPTHKGVRLYGAQIEGRIDLAHASVDVPLAILQCLMPDGVGIAYAHLAGVVLSQSRIEGGEQAAIDGDGAHLGGDLFLRNVFTRGEVRLLGADIGGDLDCDGATFKNPDGKAFNADRMKTAGDARFNNATAKGEFRLLAADIGGILYCIDGKFDNLGRIAFDADHLKTGGAARFLRVQAKGEVRLLGADIGGTFGCIKGAFVNPNGTALDGNRLKTGGHAWLNEVTANGKVRLVGAHIGGDLDCDGAAFENAGGKAFNAESAVVGNSFFWRKLKSSPKGNVDLMHMRVGVLADEPRSWPEQGKLLLDGFVYGAIAPGSPVDSKTRRNWLGRMPSDKYRPQPYRQLATVLHAMGHETDARQIAIARMDAYREHGNTGPLRDWWLGILKATAGYGYEPWRALYWIAPVILFGMLAFHNDYHMGGIVPAKERVYLDKCYPQAAEKKCEWREVARAAYGAPLRIPKEYPEFNAFIYSLDVFLPIVDLHQEDYWIPATTAPKAGFSFVYQWVHIALGWFLTSIFVAGLAGIVKDKDD